MSINKLLSNIPQEFSEAELVTLWKNLKLSKFMSIYNGVARSNIINVAFDDSTNVLSWDINAKKEKDVRKYKISYMDAGTLKVIETKNKRVELKLSTYGDYTVSISAWGQFSGSGETIYSFSVLSPFQRSVDEIELDIQRNGKVADACYSIFAKNGINSLTTMSGIKDCGIAVTTPDGKNEYFSKSESVSNYMLNDGAGIYLVRAYVVDDTDRMSYGKEYRIDFGFNKRLSLFSVNKQKFAIGETLTIARNASQAAKQIVGLVVYEDDDKKEIYEGVDSIVIDEKYQSGHVYKIAALDSQKNESSRISFSVV